RFVDLRHQRAGVDRVNHVEPAGLLRFVRLQVADEMPAERQIRRALDLLERLLHLVLAKIDLAGGGGRANGVRGKRLGDGDEANRGRVPARPAGRARDASAYVGQPGAERRRVDHYFLSVPRIPFAVAAFGPLGDSFRYVSNSVAAP